jgi:hypothetical protein
LQERALDAVQHGVDYLRACVLEDPAGFGGPLGDVYVYAVGDAAAESAAWRRPEDVKARLCFRQC